MLVTIQTLIQRFTSNLRRLYFHSMKSRCQMWHIYLELSILTKLHVWISGSRYLVPSLPKLLKQSLINRIYPGDCNTAKVAPVIKNASRSRLNNYRPIEIISVVAKIVCKLMNDQVYRYLLSNDLLPKYQSGFYANHTTLTQL